MIEWVKYERAFRDQWNAGNAAADTGLFIFDRDYMEYHQDRFTDSSLVGLIDGVPSAIFPANVKHTAKVIVSHEGLTFGGVCFFKGISSLLQLNFIGALHEYLRSEFRGFELHYKPVPFFFHRRPAQIDLYYLWQHSALHAKREINTIVQIDALNGYSKGKRLNIKKSVKAGLEVKEVFDIEPLHAILKETLWKRHKLIPTHTSEELALLKARFSENIRFFGAYLSNELHSILVLYLYKNVWHTQYMASDEFGMSNGGLDSVIDYVIKLAQTEKIKYLSFGISTESGGRVINEGLLGQKEMFGGTTVVHDYFQLKLV